MAGLFAACSSTNTETAFTHSVYVTSPECSDSIVKKTFPGIVEEAHGISLGFKTPGQIRQIHVKEGDYVRRGQLLAELDDIDYKLRVEALQIQHDQLKDELARIKRLYEQKSISANDYEKALAGLRQVAVQLQVNQNKLDYTKLYSPTDGYVESVNFSQAEMVDAGTAVLNLLDMSRLEVTVDIPAVVYLEREQFENFRCATTQSADNWHRLDLLSIVPKADGNQLYRMRMVFDKPTDLGFTPGMNVEVKLNIHQEATSRMKLPMSAIFRHNDNTCVWLLQPDSTVSRRPVNIDPTASTRQHQPPMQS